MTQAGRPATSVADALRGDSTLAELLARHRTSQRCLEAISALLPAAMREQVRAGPIEEGQWTVLVASGAAAARLRHLEPALLAAVQAAGLSVQSIRTRVRSRSA